MNSGTYIIEIYSKRKSDLTLKKFGKISLPEGYYYYSGSAQKNLYARITRHSQKDKKLFWHIDYLLALKSMEFKSIYIFPEKEKLFECTIIKSIEEMQSIIHPVKGFGSSDCRKCISHLVYSPKKLDLNMIASTES